MLITLTEDKRFLKIESSTKEEYSQLKLSLTKKIEGWQFHPLVKKGLWNGEITFLRDDKIPSGLWQEVKKIGEKFNLNIKLNGITNLFDITFNKEEFLEWLTDFFKDSEKKPRDYQIEAAVKILSYRRCLAELATSAGKSLILFICIAYILHKNNSKKVLLIVPNVSLVMQMTDDFLEYNADKSNIKIQQVYAGSKDKPNSNIIIGTFQSLCKKETVFFKDINCAIGDETHRLKAGTFRKVLDKCNHCDYKFGVSGTIPKPGSVDNLTLTSYTGPVIMNVSANYLIEKEVITPVEIKVLQLDYVTDEQRAAFKNIIKSEIDRTKILQLEQNFIINNKKRLDFITKVISKSTNNSLILFNRIEYGNAVYNTLRQIYDGEVYYVDGSTDAELRDINKKRMEEVKPKKILLKFGDIKIKVLRDLNVPLSNGTFKLAKDLKIDDDVLDNWIRENKNN